MKSVKFNLILLMVILTGLSISCQNNRSAGEQIMGNYENMEGVYTIKVPPGLVAVFFTGNENQELKEAMKNMESLKLMLVDINKTKSKDIKEFSSEFKQKLKEGGFTELLTINDSGEKISIMMLEDGESIREMMALIISHDEFFGMSLTGEIDPGELSELLQKVEIKDFQFN